MNNIYDLEINELKENLAQTGYKPYRAEQVFEGIYKGLEIEQISVLPKELKARLAAEFILKPVSVIKELVSRDGTKKLLLQLADGNIIESVFIFNKYGNTLCVSTQVGCAMGCAFCASTQGGLIRNLSAGEIIGEVMAAGGRKNIKNIVLMGSGEPLHNFDNVVKFFKIASCEKGLNISPRNISLSTCGVVPRIYDLAELKMPLTLSISLHSAFDEVRREIMPIANTYTVKETVDAARHYFEASGRRVIIEYAMIDGVNVSKEDADRLKKVLGGLNCHINLITLSEVSGSPFKPCGADKANAFINMLKNNGLSATFRRQTGADIEGACGQLRRKHIQGGQIK